MEANDQRKIKYIQEQGFKLSRLFILSTGFFGNCNKYFRLQGVS